MANNSSRTQRLLKRYISPSGGYLKSYDMQVVEATWGEKLELLIPRLMGQHRDKKLHARKMAVADELGLCKQTAYDWITIFMDGRDGE